MSQNENSQKRLRIVCFGLAQTNGTTTREGDTRITGGTCTDKRHYNAERTAVCSPDRALNRVERNRLAQVAAKDSSFGSLNLGLLNRWEWVPTFMG